MNYYLGIDPGYKSGAFCLLSYDLKSVTFFDIENNLIEIASFLKAYNEHVRIAFAMLERVHSSPRQGVASAFNFGRGYGWMEALLNCVNIPYEAVEPKKWMANIPTEAKQELLNDSMNQKEREKLRNRNKVNLKKNTFDFCKHIFPTAELVNFSKHSNRSDALGIAYYCWAKYGEVSETIMASGEN